MGKGIFTAGVAVMLKSPVTLDQVEKLLSAYQIGGRNPASDNWELGGPSVTVGYRPEVNGLVLADVVERKWPDGMGDPEEDPVLFGAWSTGHFGPLATAEGLARAAEQSWSWHAGKDVPDLHQAFVRLRASYVLGASDDAPVTPDDYDPKAELLFLSKMARALLDLEPALAYFNPNGEVLMGKEALATALDYGEKSGFFPLDAWANIRLFGVDDRWKLMDTVGMQQIDVPDLEACFEVDRYRAGEVDQMLRTVSLYLIERGRVIKQGDTVPGAGGTAWKALLVQDPLARPAREVIRLIPQDGTTPPDAVVGGALPPGSSDVS